MMHTRHMNTYTHSLSLSLPPALRYSLTPLLRWLLLSPGGGGWASVVVLSSGALRSMAWRASLACRQ